MENFRKLQKTFEVLLPFIKQERLYASLSFLGMILAILLMITVPLLFTKIIDNLVANNIRLSVIFLILFIVATLGYRLFNWLTDRWKVLFQVNVMKNAGSYTYQHFISRSNSFYEDNFSGKLVNKFDKFITAFEYLHDIFLENIVSSLVKIISVLIIMFVIDYRLGIIFIIWFIAQFWVGVALTKNKIPLSIAKARAQSNYIGIISDFITNFFSVSAFANNDVEISLFEESNNDLYTKRKADWQYSIKMIHIISFLGSVFGLVLIVVSFYFYLNAFITIGIIVLIQAYLGGLRDSIRSLTMALDKGSTQLSNAYEMYEIFQTPIEITDSDNAKELEVKKGNIKLDNVVFNYTGEGVDEIAGINLGIQAGESIGLVGHSGAGKSTLVKLLLRFVDVSSGAILIDGQDIRDVTQESLRKSIAYVPQEPLLFHRSLYDNIAYGRPEATMREVIIASEKAKAHDFIKDLPEGYDTLVGERGVKLSGGQRQRVAIARAILRDAPILILDEATSSLDSKSEQEIQAAIKNLIEDKVAIDGQKKTAIVIAHRLSTIKHLDRIIVLKDGKIVEEGTHDKLINLGGVYADLWSHQQNGFIE